MYKMIIYIFTNCIKAAFYRIISSILCFKTGVVRTKSLLIELSAFLQIYIYNYELSKVFFRFVLFKFVEIVSETLIDIITANRIFKSTVIVKNHF